MIQERITNRLEYLDFLKGFAIFLVVMGHFLAWTFPVDAKPGFAQTFVFHVIYSFHMPLFFFISGFLLGLHKSDWTMKNLFGLMKKRTISLLLPGFAFLLIRYFRVGSWQYEWFLLSLFEMYLLFSVTKIIAARFGNYRNVIEIVMFVCCILLIKYSLHFVPLSVVNHLALESMINNYPYFFIGYLLSFFKVYVWEKNWTYTMSLVTYIISFGVLSMTNWFYLKYVVALSAIFVCFKIATDIQYAGCGKMTNLFLKFGRKSLAIYLLSPMIIPWFPEIGTYIINSDSYSPWGNPEIHHITSIFVQFVTGVLISFYVCLSCMIVKWIVEKSAILNFIFFGELRRNRI